MSKPTMSAVIVSNAMTKELAAMTQKAIDTCGLKDIIVVEQTEMKYKNARTIQFSEQINYNRFLNVGARYVTGDYIAFCNNDLIFSPTWAHEILKEMQKNDLASACPYDPEGWQKKYIKQDIQYGYGVTKEFVGWCFVMHRNLYELIGLNESYEFFCADNSTVEDLKKHNVAHACIRKSEVKHLWNQTAKHVDKTELHRLQVESTKKFNRDYNQNVLNYGT